MSKTADDMQVKDGVLIGPIRHSPNEARNAKGSIHDDATVAKLGIGFKGGTVAGSVHFNLFPPLLQRAFGDRWFEQGSISMNFLNPTTDREPVRAFVRMPESDASDAQTDIWVEHENGMRVGEGTASVGSPGVETFLRSRGLSRFDAGELRILDGVEPGATLDPSEVSWPVEDQTRQLEHDTITEPLEWYRGTSPWGGPVLAPANGVGLLFRVAAQIPPKLSANARKAVGLFGAIELATVNGPIIAGEKYRITPKVAAVGQSPKTEYVWLESTAEDMSGRRVAELLLQLRYVKASSPAYQT